MTEIIEITSDELTAIVESVFGTMACLEVQPCRTVSQPQGARLTSAVHLTGDWNGAVILECSLRQACAFAGRFLTTDPPAAVNDDVKDVLGELANMIGGNLKCILARGIKLSMPSVVCGDDYKVRVCGAEVLMRLEFDSTEGTFWVTVLTTR